MNWENHTRETQVFTKKPVSIKAFQFHYGPTFGKLNGVYPIWFCYAVDRKMVYINSRDVLCIKTLEGVMTVKDGDYIIEGVKGELYPCKPDIFEATYEEETSNIAYIKVIDALYEDDAQWQALPGLINVEGDELEEWEFITERPTHEIMDAKRVKGIRPTEAFFDQLRKMDVDYGKE